MTISQIIISQIIDPFRIVLLIGLIYTMLRNRAVTGIWLPLAAGALFVAALIPFTTNSTQEIDITRQIWVGMITNGLLIGILLGLYELYQRIKK